MNKGKKNREGSIKDHMYKALYFVIVTIGIIAMICVASIISGVFDAMDQAIYGSFWRLLKGFFEWTSELFK